MCIISCYIIIYYYLLFDRSSRYFIFQNLEQRQIDSLLSSVPNVGHLSFEVWTPSGRGLQSVRFHSESLLSLDASQCRGIRLDRDLQLPNLQRLRMSLNPMKGPLGSGPGTGTGESTKVAGFDSDEEDAELGTSFSSICLYDTLRYGAPNLQFLNDLELNPGWKEGSYPELEEVLTSVCLCPRHLMASHLAREREEQEEEEDKEDWFTCNLYLICLKLNCTESHKILDTMQRRLCAVRCHLKVRFVWYSI